jgi:hypothetical protein
VNWGRPGAGSRVRRPARPGASGRARRSARGARVEGTVYVVGGAALALTYYEGGERRLTSDIDAAYTPATVIEELIAEIAQDEGISANWLNQKASQFFPAHGLPEGHVVIERAGLTVSVGPAPLLLAMKLRAARLGRDNDDIAVLLRICDIRSVDEAIAVLDECYGRGGVQTDGSADRRSRARRVRRQDGPPTVHARRHADSLGRAPTVRAAAPQQRSSSASPTLDPHGVMPLRHALGPRLVVGPASGRALIMAKDQLPACAQPRGAEYQNRPLDSVLDRHSLAKRSSVGDAPVRRDPQVYCSANANQ